MFDPLFAKLNQRESFRRYLEGLLLPAERNKTLTGLANTAPGVGAQEARAQSLQWFLSESNWDEVAVNERRRELLKQAPNTAPDAEGVLVIDETGDVKDGTHTAHVGRQYLGSVGKIDTGVVSVSSLWADERVYYPLAVIPYTPAAWFARGRNDSRLSDQTRDRHGAGETGRGVALALQSRRGRFLLWRRCDGARRLTAAGGGLCAGAQAVSQLVASVSEPGSLDEVARATPWQATAPGAWQAVERAFRDGHIERWWALEIKAGPYGPRRRERAVVVTTDPVTLPELSTWYLVTNLPATNKPRAASGPRVGASVAEMVRLYGLRAWVEQSYKQVKTTLGWAQYQVRSSRAIQRHWILVYCAFTFCWWQAAQRAGR